MTHHPDRAPGRLRHAGRLGGRPRHGPHQQRAWQRSPAATGPHRRRDLAPVTTMGGVRVVPDMTLDEVSPADSAMLILPGRTWLERGNGAFAKAARRFLEAGTLVAAICGATGLGGRGLLDDRRHTSNAREFLEALGYGGGAHYVDEPAVTDGDLITASGTTPVAFALEVFARLGIYEPATLASWAKLYRDNDAAGLLHELSAVGRVAPVADAEAAAPARTSPGPAGRSGRTRQELLSAAAITSFRQRPVPRHRRGAGPAGGADRRSLAGAGRGAGRAAARGRDRPGHGDHPAGRAADRRRPRGGRAGRVPAQPGPPAGQAAGADAGGLRGRPPDQPRPRDHGRPGWSRRWGRASWPPPSTPPAPGGTLDTLAPEP